MNLKELNEAFQYKIVGGTEYMWHCYPEARHIEYECDHATANVVFSRSDQTVYEVTIEIPGTARPYRWLNPMFRQEMIDEADSRGTKWDEAWDDVTWIDVEVEADFLEKARAIFAGDDFDRRVQVPLELDESEMLMLCMLAHQHDETLNQCVERILSEVVKGEKV